jgi:magnesium transporter
MESDEAADLIAELPEETAAQVLRMMGREEVAGITELMAYGPETAGGIMQSELLAVQEDATVAQAVEAFQKLAREEDVEDIHNVFVTDRDHRLVGVLPVRRLLLVGASTPIKRVMDPDVVSVRTDVDQEEVAALFKKYNLLSMPVVDDESRLVGRITVDDIVDVIAEESGEDILLLGGVHDEDRVFCPPGQSVRKRLPWLAINLGPAMLAAGVVSLFEGTLSKMVTLAVFMPVVAGMGGNAGTQVHLIIRGSRSSSSPTPECHREESSWRWPTEPPSGSWWRRAPPSGRGTGCSGWCSGSRWSSTCSWRAPSAP